ncbi:hypothetical protein D3C79_964860 [compost metagenome]
MGEPPVVSHLRHRVGVADDHVQVRQRGQRGAVQQSTAALDASEHSALQGGAEYGLGQ